MKVYMLNPPYMPHFGRGMRWQDTGRGGTLYYPIWLSYATGVVEEKFETKLVDAPAWNWNCKKVIKDIKKNSPELIVMDSSFPSLNNDIEVAEKIKQELPESITVIVGPPASQFPDEILQSKGVDIVARWEYDFTIREIAESINNDKGFKHINGITFKLNGKIVHNPNRTWISSSDLNNISFVSMVYKKHLNIKDYFLGSSLYPEVQIFTGRGCPYLCTFCSWPQTLMGREHRMRNVKNVVDEFEYIQKNLPEVKEIFIEDDTFTIGKKRVIKITEEIKNRKLDIVWACNARADLDYETMKKMKEAGCRLLIVGYESGSDEILKNIKKGITTQQIKDFARNARKAGLLVHGDFIIGLPGENKDTIKKTKTIIKETKPDILQVSVASPFPGTEFYEWCKKNEYLLTDDPNEYLDEQGHQKSIISYPWLSAEEITKAVDEILKGYYLSLNYVPLALKQVLRRHGLDEFRRLWYSAKMFMGYIKERS